MSGWLRNLGVVLVLLLVLGVVLASRPGSTPPIEGPKAIASLEPVEIGGVEQWLLLRGQDTDNPVVLFVHGGPGMTSIPVARQYSDLLEEHFVVVHWDQRGAGKSCSSDVPPESMRLGRFVEDVIEVADHLRQRFDEKKIFLVGHSWGSVIGASAAVRAPDRFHAYIGAGQVVDMERAELISYDWVVARAAEDNNERALEELERVHPPYARSEDLVAQRTWLGHYGGDVLSRDGMSRFVKAVLTAQEYTLGDRLGYYACVMDSLDRLWPAFGDLNFIESIPSFDLPVRFFLGRHDYNVPTVLVEEWVRGLEAPSAEIVWFEASAHMPNVEEPERYQQELIALKRLAR